MKSNIGVLLINLGTPDSPSVKNVRKYLFEFLNDPRVIDIPAIARFFLVNFIIVPFRAPKSAKIYKDLWTKDGSPILIYGRSIRDKLQLVLEDDFEVHLAMRYQNPGMDEVLVKMEKNNYRKIIIIPLFRKFVRDCFCLSVLVLLSILYQKHEDSYATNADGVCSSFLL